MRYKIVLQATNEDIEICMQVRLNWQPQWIQPTCNTYIIYSFMIKAPC